MKKNTNVDPESDYNWENDTLTANIPIDAVELEGAIEEIEEFDE